MNKLDRRKTYLLIAFSVILGFTLLGVGISLVPKDCELIGDDTVGYHTICPNCADHPQPCFDNMGNLGARIVVGLGLFFILLPPLYPFIQDFQHKKIIENKLFE